jgi:hypothetical protein
MFEYTRLAMLSVEQQKEVTKLMTLSALAVQHYDKTFEDLSVYDLHLKNFSFDEQGIGLIEIYLKSKIYPRIVNWKQSTGGLIKIARVKTKNGRSSSKKKHIDAVYGAVNAASMLLAQCIMQECDGLWTFSDGSYVYTAYGVNGFSTLNKCLKYMMLGDEDSLVFYCRAIKHNKENREIIERINDTMLKTGFDIKAYRLQQWSFDDGRIERICYIDKEGEVVREVIVSEV